MNEWLGSKSKTLLVKVILVGQALTGCDLLTPAMEEEYHNIKSS